MLKMNTIQKLYAICDRTKIVNAKDWETSHYFQNVLSKVFSDEIKYNGYRGVKLEEIDTIDRNEQDLFEYQVVEVNLDSYCWSGPVNEGCELASQKQYGAFAEDFTDIVNKYLVRNHYPEILAFYNTKTFGFSYNSFNYERQKKKKFIMYAILKDSIKFIPCEKHQEPILKEGYKLKMFNNMYADSVKASLETVGLKPAEYTDFAELKNAGNDINLNIETTDKFKNELIKQLMAVKELIIGNMFEGQLKPILSNNRITDDNFMNILVDCIDQNMRHIDIHIPTKDIL